MDVHIRDLRYFVAVAEELHFTRAAERLFVSQPALSKQIRLLERNLKTTLIVRDKRHVRLTAVGEALLPVARAQICAWDEAQQVMASVEAAANAVLTVGFSTSVGRGILPAVQLAFAERRPGFRLQLRQVSWTDPSGGLAECKTDVAFVWLPVPADGIAVRVLREEPRHVAMSANHRFAARDRVDFAELLDEQFLALPPEAGDLRGYWLAMDARQGTAPHIAGEIASAEEAFEAIENGIGIALLSAGNAAIYRRDNIATVPVEGISPSQFALAWRQDDHRPHVRDFIEACDRVAVNV